MAGLAPTVSPPFRSYIFGLILQGLTCPYVEGPLVGGFSVIGLWGDSHRGFQSLCPGGAGAFLLGPPCSSED